jgi:hypothetical protein
MCFYSVAKEITRKFNQQKQANPSTLEVILQGSDYQQSAERNLSDQVAFLGKF